MRQCSESRRGASLVKLLVGLALAMGAVFCSPAESDDSGSATGGGGTVGSGGGSASGGSSSGGQAAGGEGGESGPTTFDPLLTARGSELGAGCSVKNDCATGFSCIRGVCQPASFAISPTGKECFVSDCGVDADCCGHDTAEIPEQCRTRAAKCLAALPGCTVQSCSRSSDCAGGGSCRGRCSVTSGQCSGAADCLINRCEKGRCVLDAASCGSDEECDANVCVGGTCDCSNPSYEPADPVCADEDCDGLCLYACEESRCVLPTDCQDGEECFGSTPLCDEGKCVECASSADCSFDKICIGGRCEAPCRDDSNCPVFEACQAGQCLYVGCRSDRECTLLPSVEVAGLPAGVDPRLLRCNTQEGIGRCIVPCQTDAQCPVTEVCSGGVCKYIGCEFDAECKSIVGLHDQQSSNEAPWVSSIECRAPLETQ